MTCLSAVRLRARGSWAVRISSRATTRPLSVATAVSVPGWNGTFQVRWSFPVLPLGLV